MHPPDPAPPVQAKLVSTAPVRPEPPATLLSWLASRSAATAKVLVVDATPTAVPHLRPARACLPACGNLWRLVSSCSCRSPVVVPVLHRRVAPMGLPSHLGLAKAQPARQFPRSLAPPRPHHRQLHPVALAIALPLAQVVSVVLAVPIGTTAPNWKRCAAVRPRNSAKRCTSLGKTTIPWRHKLVGTPANRKRWCCRPAWPVLPSPSHSNAPQPSPLLLSANAARKPHVSASVAGRWNCALRGKPSRCGPK